MPREILKFGSVFVLVGAALWQVLLRDLVFVTLGIGRVIQNIDEFPYTCRVIQDERLTGCEDLWLDDEKRILYAACATTQGRLAWNQPLNQIEITARRPAGTDFLALSIDEPLENGSFPIVNIGTSGYTSNHGDSSLDLLGFDAEIVSDDIVQFYFVNHRPPIDAEGKIVADARKTGANSTIDVFEHVRGESTMRHLRSIYAPKAVYTPNNVAVLGGGGFLVTNDHSPTLNWRKELDPVIGGGGVSYCDSTGACEAIVPPRTFKMPNGLVRGADGLIYVPDTITGKIAVYSIEFPSPPPSSVNFTLMDTIAMGMPIDNLSVDKNGDIWVSGFAHGIKMVQWMQDPVNVRVSGTIWRIKKAEEGQWGVEKILEDKEAKILNAITVARHDVKSGRLFAAGVFNEFAVCEPKV